MNRTELHKLIDAVPESELPTIGSFISFVIQRSQKDPLERRLDEAPYDDEDYSAEFLNELEEARKQARVEDTIPLEDLVSRHHAS